MKWLSFKILSLHYSLFLFHVHVTSTSAPLLAFFRSLPFIFLYESPHFLFSSVANGCRRPVAPLWQLLVVGRTCLALRWLRLWIPASWDRRARPTADLPRAGPHAPPPPPQSGARARRGGSPSRRRDTGRPSWRVRSRRKAVLYLLLHLCLNRPSTSETLPQTYGLPPEEPERGVGI